MQLPYQGMLVFRASLSNLQALFDEHLPYHYDIKEDAHFCRALLGDMVTVYPDFVIPANAERECQWRRGRPTLPTIATQLFRSLIQEGRAPMGIWYIHMDC